MFQTPVVEKLTEEEGRELFEVFKALAGQYHDGSIPANRLQEITDRNNVPKKIDLIKKAVANGGSP